MSEVKHAAKPTLQSRGFHIVNQDLVAMRIEVSIHVASINITFMTNFEIGPNIRTIGAQALHEFRREILGWHHDLVGAGLAANHLDIKVIGHA